MMCNTKDFLCCPDCLDNLEISGDMYVCIGCKKTYMILDDIPLLLAKDHIDKFKSGVNKFYSQMSSALNKNIAGRFTYFLNFGFISNNNKSYSIHEVEENIMNKNSTRLVLEVIGDIECNGKRIIDISCGRGGSVNLLQKYYSPERIVGIDLCFENIEFCSKRKSKNIFYYVADAEKTPFLEESFDIVLNIESSIHYQNLTNFFEGVYRILSKEGYFLYADFYTVDKFSRIESQLKESGFSITRKQNITSNVILAIDSWDEVRKQAYIDNITEKNSFIDIKEKMKSGEIEYRIYILKKMHHYKKFSALGRKGH